MRSLSVVIPNFNGVELLRQNLQPLKSALSKVESSCEIIVVDDASSDTSVVYLKENHPDIILVCNQLNLGFAGAMNVGIARARYEIIFSMNSDVTVEDNIFPVLLQRFSNPDLFSVSPNIIDPRDGKNQASYRLIPGVCWFIDRCPQTFSADELTGDYPLFFASGGACCYDRNKLLALGGFSTIYSPFYVEDVDLSYHAWKRGWQCLLEPGATVWHYSSSIIKKYVSYRKIRFITARNKHMFLWVNITDKQLIIRYFLCLLPSLLLDIIKLRKYKFIGMFMALTRLSAVWNERKARLSSFLVSDSEIINRVRLIQQK